MWLSTPNVQQTQCAGLTSSVVLDARQKRSVENRFASDEVWSD